MCEKKGEDIVHYNSYELDVVALYDEIRNLGISSVIVYGIGNNSNDVSRLLRSMDVDVKFYIDIKANTKKLSFFNRKVIALHEFKSKYNGEYIVISPSMHEDIIRWLQYVGVSNDKMIAKFYLIDSFKVNYAENLNKLSVDINFCKTRPQNPVATFTTIAYNTPCHMFRRAIESVLRQTFKDFIYVIIINGATDATLSIAEEYARLDKRIEIIRLDSNYRWTEDILLNALSDNIYGEYWCQLDSDDYYDERFLELSLDIALENQADIIHTRTCLFCSDKEYTPMEQGFLYDQHDKWFFNIVHPPCRVLGPKNIITSYAKSEICSTFWGKLYSASLMRRYVAYILGLTLKDRELYFRLDIAMTYKVLSMSERVYFTDNILHYASYSKTNSTFSLAPIEWLMSLWYAYSNIKQSMYLWYDKKEARRLSKRFLNVHLPWMVERKGMLKNIKHANCQEQIFIHLNEMYNDEIFKNILLRETKYLKEDFREFYSNVQSLVESGEVPDDI